MNTLLFATDRQAEHLELATQLTGRGKFLSDAVAIAAYRDEGSKRELAAVAVIEAIRGGRADLYLGVPSHGRLDVTVLSTICTIAFHENHLGLSYLTARIMAHAPGVQGACLKAGFFVSGFLRSADTYSDNEPDWVLMTADAMNVAWRAADAAKA